MLSSFYALFYYTSFTDEARLRYRMGWFSIACIALTLLINVTFVLIASGGQVLRMLKLKRLKRLQKKAIKAREL